MNERMMAAADVSSEAAAAPASTKVTRQAAKDAKKATAAERIGITSRRRG